jgi:thioredoxin-like negative regulator of GroEL
VFTARVSNFWTESRFQPEPDGFLSSLAGADVQGESETTRFGRDDSSAAPEPENLSAPVDEQAPAAQAASVTPEAEPQVRMPEVTTAQQAPAPRPVSMPEGRSPYISSTQMSGGLAHVEGFESLQSIVAARPNDQGARIALAVAYTQAGHLEHALYEYRRLLQLRDISAPMLHMLDEQLVDVAEQADGMARFHQLRGDLYMKQGRFQDAIEEYNRVK